MAKQHAYNATPSSQHLNSPLLSSINVSNASNANDDVHLPFLCGSELQFWTGSRNWGPKAPNFNVCFVYSTPILAPALIYWIVIALCVSEYVAVVYHVIIVTVGRVTVEYFGWCKPERTCLTVTSRGRVGRTSTARHRSRLIVTKRHLFNAALMPKNHLIASPSCTVCTVCGRNNYNLRDKGIFFI